MKCEVTKFGRVYIGLLKVAGKEGEYYASSTDRMKCITKLLAYAKIDGYIK